MHTSYNASVCSVTAQVGPVFVCQDGSFASVVRNGAGDYTLNLQPNEGAAATECVCWASPRAVIAASGAVSMGVNHTSPTAKEVTIVQEAAAGGASTRTDVNFDFALIRIPVA